MITGDYTKTGFLSSDKGDIGMLKFIVKSRSEIENGFIPGGRSILISISDFGNIRPNCDGGYTDRLFMFFDDTDGQDITLRTISKEDADKIVDFVQHYVYGDEIDSVVVHCNAGVSRSAGCAAALAKIFIGDDTPVIRNKPLYNRKVYTEVLNAFFMG